MAPATALQINDIHAADLPRITPDRRREKRYAVTLLGRFMRETKHEYPCKLVDISVEGASMMSPVEISVDERIIAYFDHIGGLEGRVARTFDGGFAISLIATPHKREKLAGQIDRLVNKGQQSVDDRRHDRISVTNKITQLKLAEGFVTDCRVLDVSLSGASVETDARPPISSEVMLGRMRSKVMRHHAKGIALQFLDIQEPDALRRYFK